MKVTTEPGALAAAVKFAARPLTARAAYPILGGLKITADDSGVEVAAFDHETSARARIAAGWASPAPSWRPGRCWRRSSACCRASPSSWPRRCGPDLTAGRTRYTLRLLPADDTRRCRTTCPGRQADAGEFAAAVRQAVVAASGTTRCRPGTVQVTFTSDAPPWWRPTGTGPRCAPCRGSHPGRTSAPVLILVPALADVARAAGPDPVRCTC